jgi:hypothetical protein
MWAAFLSGQLILQCAFYLILCQFTLCDNLFTPLAVMALTGQVIAADVLLGGGETPRQRFLRWSSRMLAVALLLELVVFCGNCYSLNPVCDTRAIASVKTEYDDSDVRQKGGNLVVSENTSLIFDVETDASIRYAMFDVESDANYYYAVCSVQDRNFSEDFIAHDETVMNGAQKSMRFYINPYEELLKLKLEIRDLDSEDTVTVSSLSLLNVKPYSFSLLRYLIVAGILCLGAAILCFGWQKINYDSKNFVHQGIILALLLLCLSSVSFFFQGDQDLTNYAAGEGVNGLDPYAQTFDAWQNGQINLCVDVDEKLAELENPYDRSERDANDVKVQWDRAYYEGQYYSYFGIAPVLLVYYPFYLLSGKLPTLPIAGYIFVSFAMVFLFCAAMALVRRYCKEVNFLLLLSGLAATAASSGLFFCLNYPDRYFLAFSAGICFMYLYLWLGLEAMTAGTARKRCALLAGCGLAIVFSVISRPNMALYALLLVPPFWSFIRNKETVVKEKVMSVVSFALPVCIGAAGVMAYNAARFSSVFDFGMAYQLTVSDISANTIKLSMLPAAIGYYFLNPMELGGGFPYLHMRKMVFDDLGQYNYIERGFGALMFPSIAAGCLLLGIFIRKRNCSLEKRVVFYTAFVLTVLISFMDCCLGGYTLRYDCDILPILSVFTMLVLLTAQQRMRRYPTLYGSFSRLTGVAMLTTPLLLLIWVLSLGTVSALWSMRPDFYFDLRDIIVFWR